MAGLHRLPARLFRWNRIASLLLTVCLLSSSTPAAPQTISAIAGEVKFSFILWLHSSESGTKLRAAIQNRTIRTPKPQERQQDRDVRVRNVEIYPNGIRVGVGQEAKFSALAFERENVSVGGVHFTWRIFGDNQGRVATISETGIFVARAAGVFHIEAEGGGKQARATVTVNDISPNPGPRRETPVSSRRTSSTATALQQLRRGDQKSNNHRVASAGHHPNVTTSSMLKAKSAAPIQPVDGDELYRWNDENYWSADEPGNRTGDLPMGPEDGGSSSGNFKITAPIISLPGRGGMDLSLGLIYNSRLWNKAGSNLNFDIDQSWPAPGWSLGFGRIVSAGSQGDMIIDADGTRHPFAGTAYNYGTPLPTSYNLHTTDGTMIQYSVGHAYSQGVRRFSGAIAYHPDGTVVRYMDFDGDRVLYPTIITDRNGNAIQISYVYNNFTNPRIQAITDSLGRVILFHYDANNFNLLTAITASGLRDDNGNVVTRTLVRLHYRQLDLMQSGTYGFAPGMNPLARSQVVNVIDAIYFPGLNTGYWFGDSDSYSSYGMIRKVTQQRGMNFSTTTSSPLNEQGTVSPGAVTRQLIYNYPLSPDTTLQDAPTYTTLNDDWFSNDTGAAAVTHFNIDNAATPRTATITRPDGSYSVLCSYNYSSLPSSDPEKFKDGLPYETKFYDANNTLLGKRTTDWELGAWDSPRPRRIEATDEILQTVATAYSYGTFNQVSEVREYDYGSSTPLRITRLQYISYEASSPYIFLLNVPTLIEVYGGDGTSRLSRTEYHFDPYMALFYQSGGIAGTACNYGCAHVANPTRVVTYADAATMTGPITQEFAYDQLGNVVSDATRCVDGTICEQTYYTFTSDTQYAYPSSVTRGSPDPNSPTRITASVTYDFNTGLQLTTTDPNSRPTQADYSTATWRPTETIAATGAHTAFSFDDGGLSFTQTTYTAGDVISAQTVKYLNGRGQTFREKSLAAANVWDVAETKYDQIGRVWKESRPFRDGTNPANVMWTEYFYDALGRAKKAAMADGSVTETTYNDAARPAGASSNAGQTATFKDAWGRERWVRKDSQSQIVEVIEPNPDGNGSVASAGFKTSYEYDLLGNLIRAVQGDQIRRFQYDSLGRLTHQKLAEMDATLDTAGAYMGVGAGTWSQVFKYDERSNVTLQIDARGVKTAFSFNDSSNRPDPLNRLQSVSYDTQGAQNVLPAASVTYAYVSTGDLTRVYSIATSGIGTETFAYDSEGRIRDKTLTLNGRPAMVTTYLYDSLNRVTDVYYPQQYGVGTQARKVVHQDYDVQSRLSRLALDGTDYASNIAYNAASQTTSMTVGTGTNQIIEGYDYEPNTGLLASQTIARSSTPEAHLLDLSFEYANSNGKRTGQLTKILNNVNPNRDRSFTYDALGRLKQATGGPSGAIWNQTYTYDRYGNRTSVTANGYLALNGERPATNRANLEPPIDGSQSDQLTTGKDASGRGFDGVRQTKVELPTDLIAKNTLVELNQRYHLSESSALIEATSAISDTSTPLFGSNFPTYSSMRTTVPTMPQSGATRVAFASNRDGSAQIYSINTDGSGLVALTADVSNNEAPNWSPNNSRIVFQSDRNNLFSFSYDIYVMNWDGSGQTRLTTDAYDDSSPVWSPDGTKIAFQSARNGVNYQVYVMNADGSGQTNISNSAANDTQPSWSPDGTKIAFSSDRDSSSGQSDIYVMNSNGSNQTRLTFTNDPFSDSQPAWSVDGLKLAFTSTRDSTIDAWTDTDDFEIPEDDGQTFPRSRVNINREIYVMNANGTGQTRLTNTLENDETPAWSGDGTKMVFRSDRERDCCDPTPQIWVMNSDGTNPINLSNNGYVEHCPSWQHVSANLPPTVSLTGPANGSIYTAPANVSISANANDGDGGITKVDFYQGATLLGTDTTAPYSLAWNNVAAGNYALTAKATDNVGTTTTSAVVSIVGNATPSVTMTSPASGTVFTAPANINISAIASDNDGTITKVDFYQGSTLLGTDTTAPYSFSWINVAAGNYALTAKATDNGGATTTSAAVNVMVNAPPTVSITSPVNGATFTAPANITISANAGDSDGTISVVEFYQSSTLIGSDTSAPYSVNWNNVAAGSYSLTARATDNSGSSVTSGSINLTVNANGAPTVAITAPTNGAAFTAPANIAISANAGDVDGTINSVEFYQGATLIGTDTTVPYSLVWSNVGNGTYSLTAKATDNGGSITTSGAVSVVVNAANQSPTANAAGPYSGVAGMTTQFNGSGSTDPDGSISSYTWNFGDNTSGSGPTPTHTYSTAGTYTVTLRVTDNAGAQATASTTATISAPETPRDGLASVTYDLTSNRITIAGFTYDAAGNVTRGLGPNGQWQQYQYDAAGRLVKIKNDNGQTLTTYVYGHSSRRIMTQHGDESSNIRTLYAWGSEDVLVEYSESDAQPSTPIWSRSYVYLNTVLLATVVPGTNGDVVEFHHPDQLGTRLITSPGNSTSIEQNVLPFGTALDANATNRRFTSYDRGATGLDYALNRSYDSSQGRFIQVDPIGMNSASLVHPQTLNLYSYCQNDPVNNIDPAGTWGFSFSFGWGWGGSSFGNGNSSRSNIAGIFSFALGLLGSIFQGQGRHIIGTPFLGSPARANASPPPPPPKITTVALAGFYSERYEQSYPGSNSAFAARALESTRNRMNFELFRTGEELLQKAARLSDRVGTIGRLNIFSHAFSPGVIGHNSSSEGLYIGDPSNIVAYQTRYWQGNPRVYDYYYQNQLLSPATRARGARSVEELGQMISDGRINIANGGEIVFFGCYTDAIASHLAFSLKSTRPDIRVTGVNAGVSMERSGYAFTWGSGHWNAYQGDKYVGHSRSKRRSYR